MQEARAVNLLRFQGDERTPPSCIVWESQWLIQIEDYEHKFRAGLLVVHLDTKAQEQLIGVEINYEESMKRPNRYYRMHQHLRQHVGRQVHGGGAQQEPGDDAGQGSREGDNFQTCQEHLLLAGGEVV